MEEKDTRDWIIEHPWLNDDVDIDDTLRYTLDEIRIS